MLGNAVPSLLTEVLAREIRRQLLGDSSDHGRLRLIPPVRTPVPDPQPTAKLPDKYRVLIHMHPDHPGEGRQKPRKRAPAGASPLLAEVAAAD